VIAITRLLLRRSYVVPLAVLFVGFGLAHLAWPLRAARTSPAVWLVPSLERIGRDVPSGAGLSLELYAARGEYESFQVAIQAPEGGLTDVTVRVADLGAVLVRTLAEAN
jgi:hypothetical protein